MVASFVEADHPWGHSCAFYSTPFYTMGPEWLIVDVYILYKSSYLGPRVTRTSTVTRYPGRIGVDLVTWYKDIDSFRQPSGVALKMRSREITVIWFQFLIGNNLKAFLLDFWDTWNFLYPYDTWGLFHKQSSWWGNALWDPVWDPVCCIIQAKMDPPEWYWSPVQVTLFMLVHYNPTAHCFLYNS